MPATDWQKWLSESCFVFVERITVGGKLTDFRVVLLAVIGDRLQCVTRYDTAHGFAHRDILRFDGSLLRKEPMQENDFDLAFDAAYDEIFSNHERHLAAFLATRTE